MSDMTKYEAVLREHEFANWKEFGSHLFAEIPQNPDGSLVAGQICSYIQYSFGIPDDRAKEMFVALREIGIIQAADKDDRFVLHASLQK